MISPLDVDVVWDEPFVETDALAAILDMDILDFVELFGAGWREHTGVMWHDYDADPDGGEGWSVTPWHVAGDPIQLMIRVFPHGVFLALPEIVGRGAMPPDTVPGPSEYLSANEIPGAAAEHVRDLLRRRRRQLRWCRYCRNQFGREMLSNGLCDGCLGRFHHVVH